MSGPDAPTVDAPRVHHVEVPRTARYYTLGGGPATRAVWLALHGYGQLAEYFARHFAPHAAAHLVVAPEALSRFYLPAPGGAPGGGGANGAPRVGATWMTREDRLNEIGDYVRYLDRALDAATEAAAVDLAGAPLAVLGFSQGTATACRWAAHRHADGLAPPARVVLWGGAVPHDFDLAGPDGDALRGARLTLVAGDADEFATPAAVAEQEARLADAGVAYEVVRYPGGHRLDGAALGRVLGG
ncbi:esterase [Gemmatimonadetes bacterium T265]|nr:esterase [Gemmatimonadetes bacterium T265]